MRQVPVLDWTCSRCGAADTYHLVRPEPGHEQGSPLIDKTRKVPTLDWTCSRCGASETYQLVPTIPHSRSE